MDQGKTEPIAKGFAWLFLAGVLLSPNSILSGLARAGVSTSSTAQKFAPGYHPPVHAQNVKVL
jgi:hypothetical protein